MQSAATNRIEEQIRSLFPEGAIERVSVLEYGDDPKVEPAETGVRVYINRGGRPEGKEGDEETVHGFGELNRSLLRKLRDELTGVAGWIEFVPDRQWDAARHRGPMLRIAIQTHRAPALDEATEELTPVMTRLGPADLATVDTLIAAGVANSRAEVMRWALARVRENPAYAQLQQRVREIDELKGQF
jgi:hypothetical protein